MPILKTWHLRVQTAAKGAAVWYIAIIQCSYYTWYFPTSFRSFLIMQIGGAWRACDLSRVTAPQIKTENSTVCMSTRDLHVIGNGEFAFLHQVPQQKLGNILLENSRALADKDKQGHGSKNLQSRSRKRQRSRSSKPKSAAETTGDDDTVDIDGRIQNW